MDDILKKDIILMRKAILILMVAAICSISAVHAQRVQFGLKGGLNVNTVSLNGDVFKSSNQLGFFLGPTLKADLLGFGLDISALYDQRDMQINETAIIQKSILIPINARLTLGLQGFNLFGAAGPQLEFNVGDKEFKWFDANAISNTFTMKKSNLSFNIGGGVTIKNLELGVAYNVAIGKTADVDSFDQFTDQLKEHRRAHTNTWKLSLAVYL